MGHVPMVHDLDASCKRFKLVACVRAHLICDSCLVSFSKIRFLSLSVSFHVHQFRGSSYMIAIFHIAAGVVSDIGSDVRCVSQLAIYRRSLFLSNSFFCIPQL